MAAGASLSIVGSGLGLGQDMDLSSFLVMGAVSANHSAEIVRGTVLDLGMNFPVMVLPTGNRTSVYLSNLMVVNICSAPISGTLSRVSELSVSQASLYLMHEWVCTDNTSVDGCAHIIQVWMGSIDMHANYLGVA